MLGEKDATFVQLNDVVDPLPIKVMPSLGIILVKAFGLDRKTIGAEAAKKYFAKSLSDVFVDYFLHAREARFRRRHQSAHLTESQGLSCPSDSFYGHLMAVVVSVGAVGIV